MDANIRHICTGFLISATCYRYHSKQQVLAYRYQGVRYDCGSKLGYLQATVEFGQRHPEVGKEFGDYLASKKALKAK